MCAQFWIWFPFYIQMKYVYCPLHYIGFCKHIFQLNKNFNSQYYALCLFGLINFYRLRTYYDIIPLLTVKKRNKKKCNMYEYTRMFFISWVSKCQRQVQTYVMSKSILTYWWIIALAKYNPMWPKPFWCHFFLQFTISIRWKRD